MTDCFSSNYLPFLLTAARHKITSEFSETLKSSNMTFAQWKVLVILSEVSNLNLSNLAVHALFEQSRLTKLIDQMIANGLVTRTKDKSDRRFVRIKISEKGTKLLKPLLIKATTDEKNATTSISASEQECLKRILLKIIPGTSHIHST